MKNIESKPLPNYSVHPGWLQLLEKNIRQYDLSYNRYLLSKTHNGGANALLDVRDVRQILLEMFKESHDPLFAIKASQWVTPLTFDSYTLTLWTAPDVRTLIEDACKFSIALGTPLRTFFHETAYGDIAIWFTNNDKSSEESQVSYVGVTLYIATLISIIQQASDYCVHEMEIHLISWPYSKEVLPLFERYLNCKIILNSPIRKLCIKRRYLFTPLPTNNPEIYHTNRALLHQHVAQLESSDIVLQIYKVLDRLPSLANISSDTIVKEMMTSIRTLNRRLAEVNTSYRGVIEKYKLEKALHLLSKRNANMSEIAFKLGFSDLSTFSRAFKRWTGSCPSQLRDDKIKN